MLSEICNMSFYFLQTLAGTFLQIPTCAIRFFFKSSEKQSKHANFRLLVEKFKDSPKYKVG